MRDRLDAAQDLLARRGGAEVFLGRFVAFFRAVMPFLAGTARMPLWPVRGLQRGRRRVLGHRLRAARLPRRQLLRSGRTGRRPRHRARCRGGHPDRRHCLAAPPAASRTIIPGSRTLALTAPHGGTTGAPGRRKGAERRVLDRTGPKRPVRDTRSLGPREWRRGRAGETVPSPTARTGAAPGDRRVASVPVPRGAPRRGSSRCSVLPRCRRRGHCSWRTRNQLRTKGPRPGSYAGCCGL